MIQDRNIHRDAQALRKAGVVVVRAPTAGVDQDEPIYVSQPRYNYRISDLSAYAQTVGTADIIAKVQSVPPLAAVGTPQLAAAAAVTFAIEEFWHNDNDVLTNVAAIAAQAFTNVFTVLDGFWGVVLVRVDGGQVVTTQEQGPIMAFATEAIALENCPRIPSGQGTLAILTIEAVGGDFIAGTTNTNAALVNSFNTASRDGHVLTLPVGSDQFANATLSQQLKDASGTNIIQGKGGPGGDLLVLSSRSDGAATIILGQGVIDWRPWPAGGEGLGDVSVSQNRPQFVP